MAKFDLRAGTNLLFVFGTLKRGHGNNEWCLPDAQFVGEAVSTTKDFEMRRTGYPILWRVDEVTAANHPEKYGAVRGEVFDITEKHLAACDRLEGHPRMYCREVLDFTVEQPGAPATMTIKSWVYIWQQDRDRGELIKPNKDGELIWS